MQVLASRLPCAILHRECLAELYFFNSSIHSHCLGNFAQHEQFWIVLNFESLFSKCVILSPVVAWSTFYTLWIMLFFFRALMHRLWQVESFRWPGGDTASGLDFVLPDREQLLQVWILHDVASALAARMQLFVIRRTAFFTCTWENPMQPSHISNEK